jgi:hypothetical protein
VDGGLVGERAREGGGVGVAGGVAQGDLESQYITGNSTDYHLRLDQRLLLPL